MGVIREETELVNERTMAARKAFPRGLKNPPDGYRSGSDALWLADFARGPGWREASPQAMSSPPRPLPADSPADSPVPAARRARRGSPSGKRFIDLGCGSGAVGLVWLLADAGWSGLGVDRDAEACAAARENARRLGLETRLEIAGGDLSDEAVLQRWRREHGPFDLVLSNPPWRLEGRGRPSRSARRRAALFGGPETFPRFTRAAATLLAPGGRFAAVLGAERLADFFLALHQAGLCPRRLCCVHPDDWRPASLALVEAKRQAGPTAPPMVVEAPFLLTAPA